MDAGSGPVRPGNVRAVKLSFRRARAVRGGAIDAGVSG